VSGRSLPLEPLTAEAFAPFGDVIESAGRDSHPINGGMCDRFHDLARTEVDAAARIGVSIGESRPVTLPYAFDLVERHPLASQAFVPLGSDPFLVIVAPDDGGAPGTPRAFLAGPGQGVNYLRGTWHGVLTPLTRPARFLIVDRIGTGGGNLEEHHYAAAWTVGA
jgi:ureidoglycolate lyase